MTPPSYDADVLVVGAGPAGVAAAMMAASLKLHALVIEAEQVGSKLHMIGALENVAGGWTAGPQLAEALRLDLMRLQETGRCSVVQAHAVSVHGHDDRAKLALSDGRLLIGRTAVVATGVASLTPADMAWVTVPPDLVAPPLWRAAPENLSGYTYVLGADRPLGTWLRAHPNATKMLHVLCPPADQYKTAEVADDERVRIVPVSHVAVQPDRGGGWRLDVTDQAGAQKTYVVNTLLNNLGAKPAALEGLVEGPDGYCPPGRQHPRIYVAGDLRASRYQRIVTAQGSGAEAVLAYYYDTTPSGAGSRR